MILQKQIFSMKSLSEDNEKQFLVLKEYNIQINTLREQIDKQQERVQMANEALFQKEG